MIPTGTFQAAACIVYLAKDETAGKPGAFPQVIRQPVLRPAQQHVPVGGSRRAAKKPSVRAAECQQDIFLRTGAHQRRGSPKVGKAHDALKGVQRVACGLLAVPLQHNVLSLQCGVNILRGDKQRIQQLSHGVSSMLLRR